MVWGQRTNSRWHLKKKKLCQLYVVLNARTFLFCRKNSTAELLCVAENSVACNFNAKHCSTKTCLRQKGLSDVALTGSVFEPACASLYTLHLFMALTQCPSCFKCALAYGSTHVEYMHHYGLQYIKCLSLLIMCLAIRQQNMLIEYGKCFCINLSSHLFTNEHQRN